MTQDTHESASGAGPEDAGRIGWEGEQLRAAKAEAERMRHLHSRLLAAANHELRQPLQSVCLIQELLSRRVSDPAARKLIEGLDQAVASMSGVLNRLAQAGTEGSGP